MHVYSTDLPERRIVPFYVAAISIGLTYVFYQVASFLGYAPAWWISTPSALTFYAILTYLYSKYIWRLRIAKLRFSKTPDFGGRWRGYIKSSYDNLEREVSVTILQNWSNIVIKLETDGSSSFSVSASIDVRPSEILSYEYLNEPSADSIESMHMHRGTCRLSLQQDRTITGYYYTNRDRKNFGKIELNLAT